MELNGLEEEILEKNSARTLHAIFNPRSIAVIGASDVPGKWGHRMLDRPMKTGFPGAIYPINPGKQEILGLKAYPRVGAVSGDIDLAVITTPTETVPEIGRASCRERVS
jgi:acetyltransferase